jgi:hypothetical protein
MFDWYIAVSTSIAVILSFLHSRYNRMFCVCVMYINNIQYREVQGIIFRLGRTVIFKYKVIPLQVGNRTE